MPLSLTAGQESTSVPFPGCFIAFSRISGTGGTGGYFPNRNYKFLCIFLLIAGPVPFLGKKFCYKKNVDMNCLIVLGANHISN